MRWGERFLSGVYAPTSPGELQVQREPNRPSPPRGTARGVLRALERRGNHRGADPGIRAQTHGEGRQGPGDPSTRARGAQAHVATRLIAASPRTAGGHAQVDNARQGFFEEEDVQALLPHLPSHARNLVEFLYLTGWRSSEAFRLQWADIDWKRKFVLLRDSKNREPRIFPFKYHSRLEEVLRRQGEAVSRWEREHARICAAVFHWKGQHIGKLRRSWQRACCAAGMPGRLLHDFRRTAVRNLIRAGVQQAIGMKVTGHTTD
ncbi:MAG: site-specific integrase, partial [Candidatus Eisenbacteria bacterium]